MKFKIFRASARRVVERISFREREVRKIGGGGAGGRGREKETEGGARAGGRVIRIIRAAVVHAIRTNLHFK